MNTRTAAALALAAALTAAASSATAAQAQSSTPLHVGQRVRIALPDTAYIGTVAAEVVEATPDSFTIQIHSWQRELAYRDVKDIEISEGRGPRPRSMAIGAAFGFLAGEGASLIDMKVMSRTEFYYAYPPNCQDPNTCVGTQQSRKLPYPAGRGWAWRGAGTAIGMAVAFIRPNDRWRHISLVGGPAARNGTTLGVNLGL
jgi:hypothetical protein